MDTVEGIAWGVRDDIGRIVLKRPGSANALTSTSLRVLVRAIDEVLEQKPRAILLTGEGKAFCAGGDIDEFVAAGERLPELVNEILDGLHPALLRLVTSPAPLVVAVNGPAGGAVTTSAPIRSRQWRASSSDSVPRSPWSTWSAETR